MAQTREQLLEAYAALPEAYQTAWGLDETATQARRGTADRFAVVLAHVTALPGDRPLRILDIGCAQGYFSIGLATELGKRGRGVEVVGVDSLEANVGFCVRLAEHHRLDVRFLHDRFDAGFFERHSLDGFDAILALNVLHHIRELQGDEAAETALAAIRAHSRVLLCELAQAEEGLEWVSRWHESDHALLGGYAFRRKLGEFATHLGEVRRPLYACSDEIACVDGRWFAFERVLDRAHPDVADRFADQRRFFIGADTIIKGYRGDGDFGAFNRAELAAEAEVLQALNDEPQRYPALLGRADDGDSVWLARGMLPGRLLSELIEEDSELDRDAVLRGLLGELAHLEERGYYHADLRCWNMLWHDGALRLIDFGAMTRQASPLHRVALAAVIAELARGEPAHVEAWYACLRPLTEYPAAWHGLIRYLLGCPQAEFSFRDALALMEGGTPHPQLAGTASGLSLCPEVLSASALQQVESFHRSQMHAADLERHLREAHVYTVSLETRLRRESEEAAAERAAAATALREASAYVDSLKAQLQRQRAEAEAERTAAQTALSDAARYARSLESEREELKAGIRGLEIEIERMRRRFRLLKPLWPHADRKPE